MPLVIYSSCAFVKHRDYYCLQITAVLSFKAADDLTQSELHIEKNCKTCEDGSKMNRGYKGQSLIEAQIGYC